MKESFLAGMEQLYYTTDGQGDIVKVEASPVRASMFGFRLYVHASFLGLECMHYWMPMFFFALNFLATTLVFVLNG